MSLFHSYVNNGLLMSELIDMIPLSLVHCIGCVVPLSQTGRLLTGLVIPVVGIGLLGNNSVASSSTSRSNNRTEQQIIAFE
jgi:hypothetical protein